MTDLDPYRILGLAPGADLGEVRKAYRRLARRHHPGLHAAGEAERFDQIAEAYRRLAEALAIPRPVALRSVTRTFVLVPHSAPPAPAPAQEEPRDVVVEVTFGEAVRGGVASITLQREEVCAACRGAGCERCGGRGLRVRLERLRVRIPPGVEDGARLRLARRGAETGEMRELRVRVSEHGYFRRLGLDVYGDLPLTYAEAVLGAEVEVPTLDGPVRVRIPPGTRAGSRFRLAGRGVRTERAVGDHFYTVDISVPQTVTREEQEWLRRLPQRSPREGLPKAPVE